MRESMIKKRQKLHLTIEQMANLCHCSPLLISQLESGDWITHPHIAARVVAQYGAGIRLYNDLVHEDKREKQLPEPKPLPKMDNWFQYIREMKN